MRRHIALMAVAIFAVATMSPGSASANHGVKAGQYSQEVSALQAAFAVGAFQRGGFGGIFIAKLQGATFFGPDHVLPQSGTPDLPTVYGSFPTVPSGNQKGARYFGCIFMVNAKHQSDFGCKVIEPSSASFDPALRTGAIAFSVESTIEGFSMSATAFLSATTDPQPVPLFDATVNGRQATCAPAKLVPTTAPLTPRRCTEYNLATNGTPLRIQLASQVAYRRSAKFLGSIRSDVISGGGTFKKVFRSEMLGGINTTIVVDRSRPFCTNGSKPGEMPQDGPPSVTVPKAGDIEKPTAEKPMPSLPTDSVRAKFCPNDV